MNKNLQTDYQLYKEIINELLEPINEEIDAHTKKHLYESKLVYLNNLREQIFYSLNKNKQTTPFQSKDMQVVLQAASRTKDFLKELYIEQLNRSLNHLSMNKAT